MTSAQIELGVVDAPLTSYNDSKKPSDGKHTKQEMDAMYERWKKRRGGRRFAGRQLTADDLLENETTKQE